MSLSQAVAFPLRGVGLITGGLLNAGRTAAIDEYSIYGVTVSDSRLAVEEMSCWS